MLDKPLSGIADFSRAVACFGCKRPIRRLELILFMAVGIFAESKKNKACSRPKPCRRAATEKLAGHCGIETNFDRHGSYPRPPLKARRALPVSDI